MPVISGTTGSTVYKETLRDFLTKSRGQRRQEREAFRNRVAAGQPLTAQAAAAPPIAAPPIAAPPPTAPAAPAPVVASPATNYGTVPNNIYTQPQPQLPSAIYTQPQPQPAGNAIPNPIAQQPTYGSLSIGALASSSGEYGSLTVSPRPVMDTQQRGNASSARSRFQNRERRAATLAGLEADNLRRLQPSRSGPVSSSSSTSTTVQRRPRPDQNRDPDDSPSGDE